MSIFALNLTIAMGLALAIDYTLLIISRYRDELADGADRDRALVRTMATAGRTVLFSAMTVALSMVAMVLFPMYFLKSFAYAGIAMVAFAAVAAIVVAPAAIVLLGDRLGRARRAPAGPPRARQARAGAASRSSRSSGTASTKFVMRRAVPIGLAIVALLLVLGAPFLGVKWGFPDDRVLPHVGVGAPGRRRAAQRLRRRLATARHRRHARRRRRSRPPSSTRYAVGAVAGARRVGGVRARRHLRRRPTRSDRRRRPPDSTDGSAFLTVGSTAPLFSDASETQLDRLHAVEPPGGPAPCS